MRTEINKTGKTNLVESTKPKLRSLKRLIKQTNPGQQQEVYIHKKRENMNDEQYQELKRGDMARYEVTNKKIPKDNFIPIYMRTQTKCMFFKRKTTFLDKLQKKQKTLVDL